MAARKKGQAEGTERFGSTSLDVEALRQIVEMLEGTEVSHLSWTNGDERLVIRRGPQGAGTLVEQPAPAVVRHAGTASPAQAVPAASAAPAAKAEAAGGEKPGLVVASPFVGTFYRTPAPDQPPFVEVGSVVKKGQVLCIVEAMKLMNEIESETAGRISEVLVENGQPVEFGQALFRVEPA